MGGRNRGLRSPRRAAPRRPACALPLRRVSRRRRSASAVRPRSSRSWPPTLRSLPDALASERRQRYRTRISALARRGAWVGRALRRPRASEFAKRVQPLARLQRRRNRRRRTRASRPRAKCARSHEIHCGHRPWHAQEGVRGRSLGLARGGGRLRALEFARDHASKSRGSRCVMPLNAFYRLTEVVDSVERDGPLAGNSRFLPLVQQFQSFEGVDVVGPDVDLEAAA